MYSHEVIPVPSPDDWVVPNDVSSIVVKPPKCPKQAGRPKITRARNPAEGAPKSTTSVNRSCTRCGQPGHYISSCTTLMSSSSLVVKTNVSENPKQKRACSKCRESGHRANKCPGPKSDKAGDVDEAAPSLLADMSDSNIVSGGDGNEQP